MSLNIFVSLVLLIYSNIELESFLEFNGDNIWKETYSGSTL